MKKLTLIFLIMVLLVPSVLAIDPTIETVDSTTDVGLHSSIALDSNGIIHISAYEETNDDLYYYNNTGGSWGRQLVNSTNQIGHESSIAIDSNDVVHISAHELTNDDLYYFNNTGGSWGWQLVNATNEIGFYSSIAIDSNDVVHISALENLGKDLYYFNNTGGSWDSQLVSATDQIGLHTSIAIDSTDVVHISAFEWTNGELFYFNNTGDSWGNQLVNATNDIGRYSSIAIDSTDVVHISAMDVTNKDLYYFNNTGGTWGWQLVNATNDIGYFTSIAIDSNDKAHISTFETTTDAVYYFNNTGESWGNLMIDYVGASGGDTNSRGIAIKRGRLVDSSSFSKYAHLSFYNSTNGKLMYATITISGIEVILNQPKSGSSRFIYDDIGFNYTPNLISGDGIDNCSLWTDTTGAWKLNQTNTSNVVLSSLNSFNTIQTFKEGSYNWSVQCYNNGTTSNFWPTDGNYTFKTIIPTENVTFNNISTEGASQTFTWNTNFTNGNLSAWLNYSGTLYVSTIDSSPSETNISNIITLPFLDAGEANRTAKFNWITNFYGNTSTYNQTVFGAGLTNCSAGDELLLFNISSWNENNVDNHINVSIDALFILWNANRTDFINYSVFLNNSYNYQICAEHNTTFEVDLYLQQTPISDHGFTHRYFIYNYSTNYTLVRDINLYNFNGTTGISDLKITVRDESTYQYFKNVVGQLQRRYLDEAVWRTVQMDQSGDYGQLFFNIIEESTDYRIIYSDTSNNLLKTTESMKFICTGGVCDITYILEPYSGASSTDNVTIDWGYHNGTGLFSINWSDPTGESLTLRSIITKETQTGTLVLCDQTTAAASSGTHTCDASGHIGTFYVRVRTSRSPLVDQIAAWISVTGVPLSSLVGQRDSALWTFGISLTIVMAGLFSPVGGIIALVFGLIAILFLGLSPVVTIPLITFVCVLGIAIGIKVRR